MTETTELTEEPETEAGDKVPLTARIDEETRTRFKAACALRRVTMQQGMAMAIEAWMKGEPRCSN